MKKKLVLLVTFYLIWIPTMALAAFDYNSSEFKAVIKELDMQGHADHDYSTCTVQQVYYDEVKDMLNEGKSKEEIIDYYVDQYGQAALREPDMKGSGIIAWGMPAFLFLIGAGVVGYGIKRLSFFTEAKSVSEPSALSETEQNILIETIEAERRKRF